MPVSPRPHTFPSGRSQADDPAFAGLRLLRDEDEGIGPLVGLLSAFREDPGSAWLVVAVDMPFLTEESLRVIRVYNSGIEWCRMNATSSS